MVDVHVRAVAGVGLAALIASSGCGAAPTASSSVPARRGMLSTQQLDGLTALAQATVLIRYRHPSDEAARLDWDAFLPVAVDRVLRAATEDALLDELRALFARVAPTVEFSRTPTSLSQQLPRDGAAHLARWRYVGLGPELPFASWREGRDVDQANLWIDAAINVPDLASCTKAQLRATVHGVGHHGQAFAYAAVDLPGFGVKRFDRELKPDDSTISVDFDMPDDPYRVRLGIEMKGQSEVALDALSLTCANRDPAVVDIAKTAWSATRFSHLYSHVVEDCGPRRCLKIARHPLGTQFVAERDVLDARLTEHLWIHVPVVVWANDVRTLPDAGAWTPPAERTSDTASRLATILGAWATLSVFYPYFRDLEIDWSRELPAALERAAAARTIADTFDALHRLIGRIRDNHACPIHADFPIDGQLPVMLRRFGDKLIVIGGLPEYRKLVPIGSEVLAIDGVPVLQAYAEVSEYLSVATPGGAAVIIPAWLTFGRLGTSATVRIRTAGREELDVSLPRVAREPNRSLIREPRPAFGAELAPGIRYVDLEAMKAEQWQASLPSLAVARAIILDMRGYPSRAAGEMLGHFIDKEIPSPEWQIPTLESGRYQTAHWTIRPVKPRLDAKLVVLLDGRAASAAETVLQIVHDNRLAVLVGEPSSGTNGNVKVAAVPGGFSVRFTGMRVAFPDGTTVHGRGIAPDEVVKPTLEGVRAGRDEVLEAAINVAGKLIAR
jgi:hypothetical protein